MHTTGSRTFIGARPLALVVGILAAIAFGLFAMHVNSARAGVAVSFAVNSSTDASDDIPGDGICDTVLGEPRICGLRAAIQEANALNGPNIITFPASDTVLLSELPEINERVTIDASANPDGFTIDATLAGDDGLTLSVGSSGSIIRGLIIFNAPDNGLLIIGGANHKIGGDPSVGVAPAGQGNIIYSSGNDGIRIDSGCKEIGGTPAGGQGSIAGCTPTTSLGGHTIEGNRIGTTPLGTNAEDGNDDDGIDVDDGIGSTITIGGFPNLISGNGDDGIEFDGGTANVIIQDNWIGLGVNGNATDEFANGDDGIDVDNVDDTAKILNNHIAGGGLDPSDSDADDGIEIDSDGNTILGNCIGLNSSCEGSSGGFYDNGVDIDSEDNIIGDGTAAGRNVIGNTYFEGVLIGSANNVLNGNYIGFGQDGESSATIIDDCVHIDADDTEVLNNVIGNCFYNGITVDGYDGNLIENNDIGRGTTATSPDTVDEYCIELVDTSNDNKVLTNVMANCGANLADSAIELDGGTLNVILGNNITSPIGEDAIDVEGGVGNLIASQTFRMLTQGDGDLAIDLGDNGGTLNDGGDADDCTNPNCYHNYPVFAPTSPTAGCARGSAGPFDFVRIYSKTVAPGVTTYERLAEGTANLAGDFEICLNNTAQVTVVGTSTTTTASTTDTACALNCTSEFSVTAQVVPTGATPTSTVTNTPTITNTPPPTNTPTITPVPPTATRTNTPVPPVATATPALTKFCGDVNDNGSVDSVDALLILQLSAGLISTLPNAPSADVNHSGAINPIDAQLILQVEAGLIQIGQLTCS